MQVSVETTNGLERKATITVPADSFEERVAERVKSTAGDLKLPGFRPGKVPLKEVQRRFGTTLRQEVASELSQSTFVEAISEQDLSLASQATIDIVSMERGRDLQYTATFEVFPQIELVDLASLKVGEPEAKIEEADIDATVESLREQRTEWRQVERPAALEDTVNVDLIIREGGKVVTDRKDLNILLGRARGFKELQDALVGAVAGETRTFPIEADHRELLRGGDDGHDEVDNSPAEADAAEDAPAVVDDAPPEDQPTIGEATVNTVEEPLLPEVDDELMGWYGIGPGDDRPRRFRAAVRERMEIELVTAKRRAARREVLSALVQAHDFEVPKALIVAEHQAVAKRRPELYENAPEELLTASLAMAKHRVFAQLVMREIAERESVQIDDERVRQRIDEIAGSYEESAEVRRFLYGDEDQLRSVELAVLEEQVVDLVLSRSQRVVVPMSYQDVVAGLPVPPLEISADEADPADEADEAEDADPLPVEPAAAETAPEPQAEKPQSGLSSVSSAVRRLFKRR